jgi:hypothetical protein
MKQIVFLSCVLILLAAHALAQTDCPSARISLSISDSDSLKYGQISTLKVLVNNAGDAQATINKVSATLGYKFLSCDSYNVNPKERTECRITVSPIRGKVLSVQLDYGYVSCGRTRVAQVQIVVLESKELSPSEIAQVYAIDVHGGCENSYYACSSPSSSGGYSAGYKCYNENGNYYSPTKERVNIKFDLPEVSSIVLYGAGLRISVTSVNKVQDVSLYRIGSSWKPVSCVAGGDICTQPYCGECEALYSASGSLISKKLSAGGDIYFDITEAVSKAYSSGQKTLSLQLRGEEDVWESSGSASCGGRNSWRTQDYEIRGDNYIGPRLTLDYLGKDVKSRGTSFGGDICTDCCTNGETDCIVECDGGDRTMTGDPITGCSYDGQTLYLIRGTNLQQNECLNGQCKSGATTTTQSTTTTNSVTTTLANSSTTTTDAVTTTNSATTTTLGTGSCIDGTPVGQCSTWMDGLRCVDSPWGPDFEYDASCSSNPNPTTPPTSMPSPTDMCMGTAVGDCSTMMDCTRCVDDPNFGPYLDYDDTCCSGSSTLPNPTTPNPTMPPNPTDFCFGTAVGDCSTFMDCFRCVDDPMIGMPYLEYDDTCCGSTSTTLTSTTGLSTTSFVTTTFTSTSFVTTSFVTTTYVSTTSSMATTTSSTTTTMASCVPSYNPGRWNNDRRALNCNNCYNSDATSRPTHSRSRDMPTAIGYRWNALPSYRAPMRTVSDSSGRPMARVLAAPTKWRSWSRQDMTSIGTD